MSFINPLNQLPQHKQECLVLLDGNVHYAVFAAYDESGSGKVNYFGVVIDGSIKLIGTMKITSWYPLINVYDAVAKYEDKQYSMQETIKYKTDNMTLKKQIEDLNHKVNSYKDYVYRIDLKAIAYIKQISELKIELDKHKEKNCGLFCWIKDAFGKT